jgi:CheY-like chemotaxis protein
MVKNVLVVDADHGFSTILSEGLNNHPSFEARAVHSSANALQHVVENAVDLVIIDMSLPDMTPQKLVAAIREAKSDMPIMITPFMGQDVPDDIKTMGIQGVLTKPFFVGDLPKIVGEALGLELESQIPDLPPVQERRRPKLRTPTRPRLRRSSPAPTASSPPPPPVVTRQPERSESRPATTAKAPPAASGERLVATLPSWKLDQLRKNQDDIIRQLDDLNRDFRAEVILLTAGDELVAKAGTMQDSRARELAMLVARGAEAASQAAAFLGERASLFEQSLHEGNEYRLYSYSLGYGVVLSLALSTNVPLGMLKLQTKRISQDLIKKYIR